MNVPNRQIFRFLPWSLALLLTTCASFQRDTSSVLYVSVPDQRLELRQNGVRIAVYPVSTSKFGLGDERGSNHTPLGLHEIARKIGNGAPTGMRFKDRRATGEIVPPNAPGRDPIVTRILWLRGLEPRNANAFRRYIYIHGTPEERMIGQPASYGCIRMRSRDVIDLFDRVGAGARVHVLTHRLTELPPSESPVAAPVAVGNPL